MDGTDRFLDIVDGVNLLARVEAAVGAIIRKRGAAAIHVDRQGTSWSGADCVEFLQRRGVRCWGSRTSGREFVFYTSPEQSHEAHGLLMGAGVPLNAIPAGVKPIRFGSLWMGGDATTGVPKGQATPERKPEGKPEPKPGRLAQLKRELW